MKKPTFNWNSIDKYAELRNFKLEVKNIFPKYSINQAERVPIFKNWLGRQGLQLLESLTQFSSRLQDVSNTLKTKDKKLARWEGVIQIQGVTQI